jgi:DtxR family Mn-dependent transcriptional regulator
MFVYTNICMVSITKEDYLRAIFRLQEGAPDPVRAIDIARYLRLSRSTVSERLQKLAKEKMIVYPKYANLKFTKKGFDIAKNLTYKHRVIEVFLERKLGISSKEVHSEAHRLEHAMSDKVIKKLHHFLGKPQKDPHGKPIPKI